MLNRIVGLFLRPFGDHVDHPTRLDAPVKNSGRPLQNLDLFDIGCLLVGKGGLPQAIPIDIGARIESTNRISFVEAIGGGQYAAYILGRFLDVNDLLVVHDFTGNYLYRHGCFVYWRVCFSAGGRSLGDVTAIYFPLHLNCRQLHLDLHRHRLNLHRVGG